MRAFYKLPIPKEKIELILAGSGSGAEYDEIMKMLKAGAGNVKYKGLISPSEMADLMREAHIFILSSFYEGFSLVAVEALASGLRLVVNDLPVMREWIGKNLEDQGLVEYIKMPKLRDQDIPEPQDLPAYEVRLARGIMNQVNFAQRWGTSPFLGWEEMVTKYSWQAIFTKIENFYNELMNYKNF